MGLNWGVSLPYRVWHTPLAVGRPDPGSGIGTKALNRRSRMLWNLRQDVATRGSTYYRGPRTAVSTCGGESIPVVDLGHPLKSVKNL